MIFHLFQCSITKHSLQSRDLVLLPSFYFWNICNLTQFIVEGSSPQTEGPTAQETSNADKTQSARVIKSEERLN